jgi:molybdate transport system permease protein
VGYLIILILGKRGWVGQFLDHWFSVSIMFKKEGAILAAATVALPLLYLPTRAAFAAVSGEMEDAARVMGANPLQIFWHVSLPLASRGVASGLMLAYARALGEFGATVMVFSTMRATLPVSIYIDSENGEFDKAWPAVALLCAISVALTFVYNRSRLSRQE